MTKTSLALQSIRKDTGFESARAFFHYLKKKTRLSFNYSYFVRIDGGKAMPSQRVIQNIAECLEKVHADELTLAFCADSFPHQQHLFKTQKIYSNVISKKREFTPTAQKFLNLRQIAVISKTKVHYYLFLIITLSRSAIKIKDIISSQTLLKNFGKPETVQKCVDDLKEAELIETDEDLIYSLSNEFRFPEASTSDLKNTYLKLNQWDQELDLVATPNTLFEKTFIRRMSRQYLDMIGNHLELIFELIRTAEQVNPIYNDEVVKLVFKVNNGRLPG